MAELLLINKPLNQAKFEHDKRLAIFLVEFLDFKEEKKKQTL